MKPALALLLLSLATFLSLAAGKPDKMVKVVAHRGALNMTTPQRIDCDGFEAELDHDTVTTKNPKVFKSIQTLLAMRKEAPQYHVDTRCKLFIYYTSGKVDTLCITQADVYCINGTVCLGRSRSLQDYIYKL